MLVTPVQPNNSLNNIVPNRRQNLTALNLKIDPKPAEPVKKNHVLVRKNFKPRGGTSQALDRKKVLLELKLRETMQRANQGQSIEDHKEDLIRRKQILADILKEYEQISKDKNILTAEIKNMKKYLSDIRSKLDASLTVLNRNTTLFAMKRGITRQLLDGSKNKQTKKPRKKLQSKSGILKSK